MKLKYVFCAVLTALMLIGCSEMNDIGKLSEISLDKTFLSIPENGGSASVAITATENWSFDAPTWLTASQTSGAAGQSNVTFSAAASAGGREAEIQITCGSKTQFLVVRQGSLEAVTAKCSEIIAGPDGKTYRVKGVCSNIYNTTYGNWHINDGTGDVTIYGTLDKDGKEKNFTSLGIEEGDVVTVEGPKTTYNGTVELVNVTVIKIEKSLIKIMDAPASVGKNGGVITVTAAYKGSGAYPKISADWVSCVNTKYIPGVATIFERNPADTAIISFRIAPNSGSARSTEIVVNSSNSSNASSVSFTLSQEGAIVTCSVAEFLAAPVGDAEYRVTGVITKVANSSYGNIYIKDYSGEVYVYGLGAKGDFEKLGLKVGDIVTLVGKRGEYKGTAQMTGAQYESHIPVATKTVAELRALDDDKNTWFMVTGTVTKPDEPNTKWDIETYGNLNLTDGTGSIYVYGVSTGVNGESKKFGTLNVKEGDILTIIGYRTSYTKNDYKLLQMGGAMYVSHVPAD